MYFVLPKDHDQQVYLSDNDIGREAALFTESFF